MIYLLFAKISVLRRQLRRIPSAAERFDQQDTRRHAAGENIHRRLFILQSERLSRDHLQISGNSLLVLIGGNRQRLLRIRHGRIFGGGFLFEDAQSREIIFHLLEGSQDRLPVVGNRRVVGGAFQVQLGVTLAGVEQRLRHLRADRPEAAWPGQPRRKACGFKATSGAEQQRREERCLGNADLLVGRRHLPLR